MTAAIAGKGTQLKMGDGQAVEAFTKIAEVLDITGPSESMATLDATSQDSAAKEFIDTGFVDGGEVTLQCHWVPTVPGQQQGLRTNLRAGGAHNFELVLPDTSECAFAAIITNIGVEIPFEGKITQSVTLKVTGLPTWTYPA